MRTFFCKFGTRRTGKKVTPCHGGTWTFGCNGDFFFLGQLVLQQLYRKDEYELLLKRAMHTPSFLERIPVEQGHWMSTCSQERDRLPGTDHARESVCPRWQLKGVSFVCFPEQLREKPAVWQAKNQNIGVFNPQNLLPLEDEEGKYLNELGGFFATKRPQLGYRGVFFYLPEMCECPWKLGYHRAFLLQQKWISPVQISWTRDIHMRP